jgi:hypothetical protein
MESEAGEGFTNAGCAKCVENDVILRRGPLSQLAVQL